MMRVTKADITKSEEVTVHYIKREALSTTTIHKQLIQKYYCIGTIQKH